MRVWFFTNTTYGNWLPGDPRGSVTSVRDLRPDEDPMPTPTTRFDHNRPGTPAEELMPGLHRAAREQMRGPPIRLTLAQAEAVLAQFQETAAFRVWSLRAVSIMANHFHAIVETPGDPDPTRMLADLKAWATRCLNERFGRPSSGTWWTLKGSKRKLDSDESIAAAIRYTLHEQEFPLVVWSPETGRIV